jgi:hypothetical protein
MALWPGDASAVISINEIGYAYDGELMHRRPLCSPSQRGGLKRLCRILR